MRTTLRGVMRMWRKGDCVLSEVVWQAPNLAVLRGAVNTGVLISGDRALLFDCCDTVDPERLAGLGVREVEMILCTQHRRPNTAGAAAFAAAGAAVVAPGEERRLLEDPAAYWCDPANRWHIYHHQPGMLVPATPVPLSQGVSEGDVIHWRGHAIRVLDTPGATDGSVSYLVETDGACACFSGDALYGPGQLWDLHSLQKGCDLIRDYHGFMGNADRLKESLRKLAESGADVLVPSHGDVIRSPGPAVNLLIQRLSAIRRNYTSISCLNHYFPALFADNRDDPTRMRPVSTMDPPPFVRRVAYTSFALVSDSGAALLVDCGNVSVVRELQEWIQAGKIGSVEGCWITHYHDDHVDGFPELKEVLGCPVLTVNEVAEVVESPSDWFLPCISPNVVDVDRRLSDGETWTWQEYRLTAFHLPGQTLYHSGLLAEGHGLKVFFAGDSGSPAGIDDHCCGNRNFLGPGRGFRRCMDIWCKHMPDMIFNEHQDRAFRFDRDTLAAMDAKLAERERLFAELLPWPHPDFGTDEHWVRCRPYEQEVRRGCSFAVNVLFTNHGEAPATARAEPVLPEGWKRDGEDRGCSARVGPRTDGFAGGASEHPDGGARIVISPSQTAPPGQYIVPFRVTWDGRYLGPFRHAIVHLR